LSFFLKTLVSVITRRSFGRQFHSAGPEKEKARSAIFVHSLGFEYPLLLVLVERRPDLRQFSTHELTSSARYAGHRPT